ncbi:MAG TPA: MBL fold metallo-hydrolase [Candidatus Limnocylindrales bacterium]|nr:MBL fold metallo-hydrolase [Candidatus Limnocylindrales bacterium]
MTTTFRIGAIEVAILADGSDAVPPDMILVGASAEESGPDLASHLNADGQLPVACNAFLLRSGARIVLVDAGYGDWADSPSAGGSLGRSLATAGVAPADVGDVIVSHGHADHIGGLARSDQGAQVPVFQRATHWFAREEWAYWTGEDTLAGLPADLADAARACLPPLAGSGLVRLFNDQVEVAPGVIAVRAAGHTPGHAAVAIESDGMTALIVGDAIFHPLNVVEPTWGCVFDVDPAAAERSRLRLLERAAADGSVVFGPHLAGAGRVERRSGGYRLVPVAASPPAGIGDAAD